MEVAYLVFKNLDCEAVIAAKDAECDAKILEIQEMYDRMLSCFVSPEPDCPTMDEIRNILRDH